MVTRSKTAKTAPAAAAPAAHHSPAGIFDRLAAPFPVDEVDWRVGSTNKKAWEAARDGKPPRRGKPLCYVDARTVMDRFDDVLGPMNWATRNVSMANGTCCCEIEIRVDGEWSRPKSNGAGNTDMEGDKGAYSDAFKRAAVLWGVGRYLYGIDSKWIELDERWGIPKDAYAGLRALLERNGEPAQSARASRKSGDYEKVEGLLRGAKNLKALANVWNTHQQIITKWPDEWIERITEEKDRCKKTLAEVDRVNSELQEGAEAR